jgi:hypothetical protein
MIIIKPQGLFSKTDGGDKFDSRLGAVWAVDLLMDG